MHRTLLSIRAVVSIAAVAALAACSDSSPVAVTDPSASLARGSGGGGAATATKQTITLSPSAGALFASAKGKAKFAAKPGERELQIEVENVPAGTSLIFTVGGVNVGTATADALRQARINLNSTLGNAVPLSVTGASVIVTTAAGGAVVSGSF